MKIGIYSTNIGLPWGASEKLWSEAALLMQERGHCVQVNYKYRSPPPQRLVEIQERGGRLFWREPPADGLMGKLAAVPRKALQVAKLQHERWLMSSAPDLVLISVSYHTDDVSIASTCLRYRIPFAILLHCASRSDWITSHTLKTQRQAYLGANRCFFVSAENHRIMETLLAAKIEGAQVVDNPLTVTSAADLPWLDGRWRLACVGRLHFRSKGQDLILNVLRQSRWRDRPLEVVFWGEDQGNKRQIEDLSRLYGLQEQIVFGGYASPKEIWAQSHALLLPSRYEGMPMVTAEAMMCGRIAIVTACGRNPEWVDDGETGFLAAAPTIECLDEAMERAWERRHDWQNMGQLAAVRIRERYSRRPVEDFANRLEEVAP